jgi:hypothetical protein
MYTKGKWIVSENSGKYSVIAPYKRIKAVICKLSMVEGIDIGNTIDNAKLIAAAPELLATLKLALKTYSDMTSEEFKTGMDRQIREKMAAVIASVDTE